MKYNETEVVIPFFKGLIYPFEQIKANGKGFFYLTTGMSLAMTIISFLLGRNLLCSSNYDEIWFYCSGSSWPIIVSSLLLWLGMAFYINRWHLISYGRMGFREALYNKNWMKDIKTAGFIVLYLLLWGIAGTAVYWLNIRKAAENWKFELFFFFAMSVAIVAAVILIVNFLLFARFLQGKQWYCLNKTFWPMFDNLYKVSGWFIFYLAAFAFLYRIIISFFMENAANYIWLGGFAGDFFLYFLAFAIAAVFVSLLNYQTEFVFEKDC